MSALAALRSATRIQRQAWSAPSSLVASSSRRAMPLTSSSRILLASRRAYSTPAAEEKPAGTTAAEAEAKASSEKKEPELSEEQKAIAAKDAEILDLTSRLRYAQADFQNLQRISEREKASAKEFAITRFASDILSTADVLSLALASVPAAARADKAANPKLVELYEGVELTQRQLLQTLAHHGVKPYDPLGEKFDPNVHEALYTAPAPPGKEPGTVIDVQKLGYKIKERTLRAPQVGVAQEI
ncbi:GrpE-domain-containing protein [Clavulina sp. PMI_390]|nr:GrpE-domain-containing protein [Clavulina sp. PMI_390]